MMQAKRSAETRQRIIKTALRVFLRKGYDRASMRQIAAGAGVTKGGIYHHFESKEDLFRQALAFITARMEKWSMSRFKSVRTAEGLIHALIGSISSMHEAFAEIVGESSGPHPYTFLEVLINAARRDERVRQEMETVYSRTRENLKSVFVLAQKTGEIRPDIDCDALALEINALMEGIMLLGILDRSINLDTAGAQVSQNLWRMLAR
jgi:AcrR family transcriptional regulator